MSVGEAGVDCSINYTSIILREHIFIERERERHRETGREAVLEWKGWRQVFKYISLLRFKLIG